MDDVTTTPYAADRRHFLGAAAGASALLFAPAAIAAPPTSLPTSLPGNAQGAAMSYAPLNPKETVILFADLQAGIIERGVTNELPRLRRAVLALAKLARLFDIPAILTTAPGSQSAPEVTPEIAATLGGLHVEVVIDACSGVSARTEDAALRRLVQAGVTTTSVASVGAQLAGDLSQAKGGQALGILYEMMSN